MKRLTIRNKDGAALIMGDSYPSEKAAREDLMRRYKAACERLADYEDTGLTPEEISDIAAREDSIQEVNDRIEERCETLEDKHWEECRQIALYDDELRRAKELLQECYDALDLTEYPGLAVDIEEVLG